MPDNKIPRETCDICEAARRLGLGRNAAYEAVKRNAFPVPVIRVGRRILVPMRALNRLLSGEAA